MRGKIKFFKQDRKFGFISVEDGKDDFYFHITNVSSDAVKCTPGEDVEFDAIESKRRPGSFEANNIRHPIGYEERKFRPKGHPSTFLFQWGYTPLDDITQEDGSKRQGVLHKLAELALTEDWAYGEKRDGRTPFPILRNYIVNTFYKLYRDDAVMEVSNRGENWAAFNTGLVNELYDPIYALYAQNTVPNRAPWKFHAFCCANIGRDGQILVRNFNPLPPVAKYFRNAAEVIFDPDVPISLRYDHIIYDSIERGRFPTAFLKSHLPPGLGWKEPNELADQERTDFLRQYRTAIEASPKTDRDIRNRINDAVELAVKRARWNFKTAIPLYYPRSHNMSLLLPIALVDDHTVDLALVVSRTAAGGYSGETVYKLKWAYDHARLVCRPDSDWLTPDGDGDEGDLEEDENGTTGTGTPERSVAAQEINGETASILPSEQTLACPKCEAQYNVPRTALLPSGRDVNCSSCGTVFFVKPGV